MPGKPEQQATWCQYRRPIWSYETVPLAELLTPREIAWLSYIRLKLPRAAA